ncbi:MAG: DUF2092 domain-containing protein [Burkholderiales bacterium]|jgi:hypothetical protein|nr:DUF2092 domain-containing protein [Burkholderiales bacterium]
MDDSAIAALVKMRQSLQEQKSIYAKTEGTVDHINEAGFLIKELYRSEVWIDQPHRLRLSSVSGKNSLRELFFDGKTVTFYDIDNKLYATMPLPGTLDDLFDTLRLYGIELPFTSIYHIFDRQPVPPDVSAALDLGKETVSDIACRHYAYRKRDLDWQMWVPEDGMLLPIRFAAINRASALRPQYIAQTQWEKKDRLDDAVFAFKPPKDARQVTFKELSKKKVSSMSAELL